MPLRKVEPASWWHLLLYGKSRAWLEASSCAYCSGTESVNTLPGKCSRRLSQCQMHSKKGYSAFLQTPVGQGLLTQMASSPFGLVR